MIADSSLPIEVDRAYENLQKSGKGFMMGGRRKFSPMHHGPGSARSTPDFGKYALQLFFLEYNRLTIEER